MKPMNPESLIRKYLTEKSNQIMQIATVSKTGQPWICTVHFVADKQGNIYWLSLPTRRHSQYIAENNQVAIAVVIKKDMPVIGIQAEGRATQVKGLTEIAKAMAIYTKKYATGKDFYKRAKQGVNNHKLYKFTADQFQLFDEVNFADSSPQLYKPERKLKADKS